MNKDRREPDYPAELESQIILRMPEEPAKQLRELLRSGDSIKNRLTIQVDNDMRHGEVKFDNWLMHAKIVDLPTVIESLKTIDTKSFYKTADICQMMICKEEPDQVPTEEESPSKNKKKDPYKVDKKFLWPHGITPPTKNVRKRRFRKTLKKKCVEAPEIEKEVKRLLRADNEAESISWEVIKEDEEQLPPPKAEPSTSQAAPVKPEKKTKQERHAAKREPVSTNTASSSNVVDIFGGAVSDSDLEEDNVNIEDSRISKSFESRITDVTKRFRDMSKKDILDTEFDSQTYKSHKKKNKPHTYTSYTSPPATPGTSGLKSGISSEDDGDYQAKDDMTPRIEQLKTEVAELKQRRQRTQLEIAGMENQALRQRFQEILTTLNQDIMYKEMEYQGLLTLQTSEVI